MLSSYSVPKASSCEVGLVDSWQTFGWNACQFLSLYYGNYSETWQACAFKVCSCNGCMQILELIIWAPEKAVLSLPDWCFRSRCALQPDQVACRKQLWDLPAQRNHSGVHSWTRLHLHAVSADCHQRQCCWLHCKCNRSSLCGNSPALLTFTSHEHRSWCSGWDGCARKFLTLLAVLAACKSHVAAVESICRCTSCHRLLMDAPC